MLEKLRRKLKAVPDCRSVKDSRELERTRRHVLFLEKVEQLKHVLYAFTNEAATLVWHKGEEEFKQKLLLVWWHELQRLFRIYDRPRDCGECNEYCRERGAVVCINQQLELFGCALHGTVHDCRPKLQQNDDGEWIQQERRCPCTRTTRQHDVVCVFSGAVAGKYLTQASTKSRDFSTGSAGSRRAAGFTYRMMLVEKGAVLNRFENADAAKSRKRKADDEPSSSEFVVQRTHKVGRLKLTDEQFHKMQNHYGAQRRAKEITQKARMRAVAAAQTVIDDVVFDKHARRLINTRSLIAIHDAMSHQLTKYHYSCKRHGRIPNFVDCVAAYLEPRLEIKLLCEVDRDTNQRNRFGALVEKLWHVCNKSPAKLLQQTKSCTLKQLALAVLYEMRSGMFVSASSDQTEDLIVLIPQDETLWLDLPDEALLHFFGAEQRNKLEMQLKKGAERKGTGESQTRSDYSHGTRRKKRKKMRRNDSSFNARRINVAGLPAITERDLTPAHLLDESLGSNSRYCSQDVTRGLEFLRTCVNSFDEDNRAALADLANK